MPTLTNDAVTLYDIKTNTAWETMSVANGESSIQCCYDLGDTIQEYDTVDRAGNPLRIVLQTNAPSEYREADQGGVYVFPR
ncbi:hypothetical protein ACPESV_24490 [Streptomyces umbrinus]|uniref:hypothetical protein n=1 Tax=Streptomyces umbrinus TaxID=67370 RepID=UPI003C2E3FAB